MVSNSRLFGVNTYSYTLRYSAADCLRRLSDQGYEAFELMMYPGHLWPPDLTEDIRRELKRVISDRRLRIVSLNMPNVDLNIAGASSEMREYSLRLLSQFVRLAGELESEGVVIGPGKANPLFPAPRDLLLGHLFKALDLLCPLAEKSGTRLYAENLPFGFIPDADGLMAALDLYGNDDILFTYDVANGHFIGESPSEGLRRVRERLRLVHFSDTTRRLYRHDAVGLGDVPFDDIPQVLREIEYRNRPMLEIISAENPDCALAKSVERLYELGFR